MVNAITHHKNGISAIFNFWPQFQILGGQLTLPLTRAFGFFFQSHSVTPTSPFIALRDFWTAPKWCHSQLVKPVYNDGVGLQSQSYRGRVKTRDWKTRDRLTGWGWKMRDWKTRDQSTRVENAGLENAGPSYRWVENARPVAMERRWYQYCKTEIDVVVRCQKHTRTGNIVYAVINSYRKNTRYWHRAS